MRNLIYIILFSNLIMSCNQTDTKVAAYVADGTVPVVYFNGDIITMESDQPQYAEAIAVNNGKIIFVGSQSEAIKQAGSSALQVDLEGKTLVPGFVDSHSHIIHQEDNWDLPGLEPPPVGDVASIADIIRKIKDHITIQKIPAGTLVMGRGYDDGLLKERRHPTRADLDLVSPNHPVIAMHVSGHLLVANTAALKLVGYTKDTKDPAGGHIRREPDGSPNGVIEELAAMPFLKFLPKSSMPQRIENLKEIQDYYASMGITTAQDGLTTDAQFALINEAKKQNLFKLDVVSYPRWDLFNDVLSGKRKLNLDIYHPGMIGMEVPEANSAKQAARVDTTAKINIGKYQQRVKYGGIKITADGSPQGKTAYLTLPYKVPPEGSKADYRGYPSVTQKELDQWLDASYKHNVQVIVHCNGDAAADMMISAVRKAVNRHGKKDIRPVMIHAQMIRHDQVDSMHVLGIIPSFFVAHTFFWGDWHINETVGKERAFGMSPAAYALMKGIPFTIHTDAPVIPPDQLMLMWTAVNRTSRSGTVVGPGERIPAYQALKAITINGAYQYHEEGDKGSFKAGKQADMVVLDRNPLKVAPNEIRNIRVLETLNDGVSIFRRPAQQQF